MFSKRIKEKNIVTQRVRSVICNRNLSVTKNVKEKLRFRMFDNPYLLVRIKNRTFTVKVVYKLK